jgi:hypothetical protein
MTIGKGKRPSDPNQLAKWIVDRSTAEPVEEIKEIIVPDKPSSPVDLSAYMASIGRKGGQIGGKRRPVFDILFGISFEYLCGGKGSSGRSIGASPASST